MTYTAVNRTEHIWYDLRSYDRHYGIRTSVVLPDPQLEAILHRVINNKPERVPFVDYGIAADYIEDRWDHLLTIAQTAEGVNPEPLLRGLVDRLRLAFAEGQQ